jgi:hypothetical protein
VKGVVDAMPSPSESGAAEALPGSSMASASAPLFTTCCPAPQPVRERRLGLSSSSRSVLIRGGRPRLEKATLAQDHDLAVQDGPGRQGGEEEGEAKQAGGCVPMATNWTADFCSKTLFDLIHPEGLPCPRCHEPNGLHMFRRHLNSWIVDYRCSHCWRIFNPWEGDALERSHHPHRELLGMILGMTEGKPTTHLADRNGPHPQS